ncbi:MAG: hypothetical protein GQ574_01710 [Crocinitomix sp.]|nr:hypothetical protein [Crocinitomix sp.]
MTHTSDIDTSSKKAKALLEYLRTLEFIKEENHDGFVLTDEHTKILEQRRENRMNGTSKTHAWDDVKNNLGSKNKYY